MRQKLQDSTDTIISLRGELRNLRDGICNACKRKFVPANLESSQDVKTRAVASATRYLPSQKHTNPPVQSSRIHQTSVLSKLSRSFGFSSTSTRILPPPPQVAALHRKFAPIFNKHIPSSKATPSTIEPSISRWSVERGAHQAFEVSFVRALINSLYRVYSVRFSPDGKYLAAGLGKIDIQGEDAAVVVYNVETGQKKCVLATHSSQYSFKERPEILGLSFSPDSRYLAVGDKSGQVTVWNIPNKRIRSIFRGHSWSVESVTFSPNGRFLISVSWQGEAIRLWNLRDGTTKTFSDAEDIWSARFSPDGKYIAAGITGGMLMIWDVRTGRMVKSWNCEGGSISRVAFTLDGMGLLTGHDDGTVTKWDIGSLGVVQSPSGGSQVPTRALEYKGLKKRIYGIAVSPGARWVAAVSAEDRVVIWDSHNGTQQCTLIGHGGLVASIDFSPSSRKYIVLGGWDGHVTVWKYASP